MQSFCIVQCYPHAESGLARMVIAGGCLYPNPSMQKGVVCHSTLDNNDGRQNTLTGSGTTHDTNVTLFQIPSKSEETLPTFGEQIEFTSIK